MARKATRKTRRKGYRRSRQRGGALVVSTLASGFGPTIGIATTTNGSRIYVAEKSGIKKLSASGAIVSFLVGGESVSSPIKVYVDSPGNVYYTQAGKDTITKVSPAGDVLATITVPKPESFTVGTDGNIYVVQKLLNSISKVTSSGSVSLIAGGTLGSADGTGAAAQFNSPTDIAIDSDGNLFVTDSLNNSVRKITPSGIVTKFASGFTTPTGITIDKANVLYVCDSVNNCIRKVNTSGVVSTFVGMSGVLGIGSTDGSATSAKFFGPVGVTADSVGTLYVTDALNFKIRKIIGGSATPAHPEFLLAETRF